MCLYPKLIRNKKYTSNKKNGGVIPAVSDIRVLTVAVGCGKCMECMKQKAREWQVRLLEEVRNNKTGKFVTMTFSNESIKELTEEIKGLEGYNLDNQIATLAVRRFLERYRKKYKKSIRHWLVTELGHNGTENIHLHGILFTDTDLKEIEKIWKYGFMWKGYEDRSGQTTNYVGEKTVNYITKYINKVDEKHKEYKSKVLCSPGIGSAYMERPDSKLHTFKNKETIETYRTRSGHKMALPKYYRNKIYSDEEREKLWLNLLDKEERWVCGEKIDISKNDKDYMKALYWHRARNKQLGYGDDSKNWNQKLYENTRRKLLQKQRINAVQEKEEKQSAITWGNQPG